MTAALPSNLDDAILWVIDEIWLGGGATAVSINHELDLDPRPNLAKVRNRLRSMVRRGVLVSEDNIDYQYHEKRERWCWTPCKIYYRPEER